MDTNFESQNFGNIRLASNMNTYSTRESVLKLGIDIAKALISYRENGICHAILTPADISVSELGEFRLDYMPAKMPPEKPFSSLVQLYSAPEARVEFNSEQSVIYSLGTIMYKLMNGGMEPFRTESDFEGAVRAYELRRSGLKPVAPANADAGLSSIILKACEYKTSLRYSTLREMLDDLILLSEGKYGREFQKNDLIFAQNQEHSSRLPFVWGGIGGALLCLVIIIICINCSCNDTYIRAVRKMRDGKYDEARIMFEDISWYKDSYDMRLKCDYREAAGLIESGDADGAIELLEGLVALGYEEAKTSYNDAIVAKAEILRSEGRGDEAEKLLISLAKADETAKEMLGEHKKEEAMTLMKQGKYDEAGMLFNELGDEDMASECIYRKAKDFKRDGRYAEAMSAFASVRDYNDSDKQHDACEELLIEKNTEFDMLSSAKQMEGIYQSDDGYYVEYAVDKNGTLRAKYNLPYENGKYFRLEDGVHYHSRDGETWTGQWIYEAASPTELTVYNYISGKIYTLIKQ